MLNKISIENGLSYPDQKKPYAFD